MVKKIVSGIMFVFLFVNFSMAANAGTLEKAMVKIITVSNAPDYLRPWQMLGQYTTSGSGCIIEGNRILTNAHVISNATFIQVNKSGETTKYVAEILAVDHECDLALLTVGDKSFFNNSTKIPIGGVPEPGEKVKVYGFPIGGDKLSVTEGVVSRIEIGQYSHSSRSFLTIQIDAAINQGNSGGPVLKDGKIIGVAFQSIEKAQNIGYAIPTVMIKHFLNDLKDNDYKGFPTLGISTQGLENEAYRKKLGMKKGQTGVIVREIEYGSPSYGVLKAEDVILSINGVKIENDGTVPYGRSRIDMSFITDLKYVGDRITIEVLRDKQPIKLNVVMKNYVPIIPRIEYDVKPVYYIFGGLVFTRLTINYIYSLWNQINSRPGILDRVVYEISTPEKQQIVVLQQVLADEVNKGYHDFSNLIVKKVNGETISDTADLIKKIENAKGEFLEIELEDKNKITLETQKAKDAGNDILKKYGINYDRSEDLRTQ
ncbi:MAG: trypsin-like peptidase domain-containing protein [Candidatus Goldbacteria bacterium]|nr:trypsin-like peptidase domain-containing protein [Candidatus Goldiibacteriota bacterium]